MKDMQVKERVKSGVDKARNVTDKVKKVKMVEKVVYVILENGTMEIQVQKW